MQPPALPRLRPADDNVIFYDTEFSSLDPHKGELLSIGIVKLSGEELYVELEHTGECDPWVIEHILPTLTAPKLSRPDAIKRLRKFVGKHRPYSVAFVNQFDTLYMHKLFGVNKWPFYWLPIDFASMLFAHGLRPEDFSQLRSRFYGPLGIDPKKYRLHHALDDARLLRDVYCRLLAMPQSKA